MKILLLEINNKTNLDKIYKLAHKEDVTDIIINSHNLFKHSVDEILDIFPKDNINTYLMINENDNRIFRYNDYLDIKNELGNITIINSYSFCLAKDLIIYNELTEEYLFSDMDKFKIFINPGKFKYEHTNNNIFVSLDSSFVLIDYADEFKRCFRITDSKKDLL